MVGTAWLDGWFDYLGDEGEVSCLWVSVRDACRVLLEVLQTPFVQEHVLVEGVLLFKDSCEQSQDVSLEQIVMREREN